MPLLVYICAAVMFLGITIVNVSCIGITFCNIKCSGMVWFNLCWKSVPDGWQL